MVHINDDSCPMCGEKLKYYDSVPRIVRTKNRIKENITIRRFKCTKCGTIHREIPNNVMPYKQYNIDIIRGVINGEITSDMIDFEDYPCNATMIHWRHTISMLC